MESKCKPNFQGFYKSLQKCLFQYCGHDVACLPEVQGWGRGHPMKDSRELTCWVCVSGKDFLMISPLVLCFCSFHLSRLGWSSFPPWQWVTQFSGNKTLDLPGWGAPSTFDGPLSFPLLISPAPPNTHIHTQFILHVLSCKNRCKVLSYNGLKPTLFLPYLQPRGISQPGKP